MRPAPPAVDPTSSPPFASRMPIAGCRSTEHFEAATRTTVVRRDPAAPSTRSWDALRSAAVHAGAAEIPLGVGVTAWVAGAAVSVGATVSVGVGPTVGAAVGETAGVPEQPKTAKAINPASNGAATRARAYPRRSAMRRRAYRRTWWSAAIGRAPRSVEQPRRSVRFAR